MEQISPYLAEMNAYLFYQPVVLPSKKTACIFLPDQHHFSVRCTKRLTIQQDLGILLEGSYILVIDKEQNWIVSYGRFFGDRALAELPQHTKSYFFQILVHTGSSGRRGARKI